MVTGQMTGSLYQGVTASKPPSSIRLHSVWLSSLQTLPLCHLVAHDLSMLEGGCQDEREDHTLFLGLACLASSRSSWLCQPQPSPFSLASWSEVLRAQDFNTSRGSSLLRGLRVPEHISPCLLNQLQGPVCFLQLLSQWDLVCPTFIISIIQKIALYLTYT